MVETLFEDIFRVEALDPDGKKFDRDGFTWLQRIKVALRFASLLKFLHAGNPKFNPYIVHNLDAAHILLEEAFSLILQFKYYDRTKIKKGHNKDKKRRWSLGVMAISMLMQLTESRVAASVPSPATRGQARASSSPENREKPRDSVWRDLGGFQLVLPSVNSVRRVFPARHLLEVAVVVLAPIIEMAPPPRQNRSPDSVSEWQKGNDYENDSLRKIEK